MKKLFQSLFNKKNLDKKKPIFTSEQISDAYKKSVKEIESLRKYDRGEKNIIAPDLRNITQHVSPS